jgi:polar amino acid transport system substrate-binding protein
MMAMLVVTAGLLASCGVKTETITSPDQLNKPGIQIGVATDTNESTVVEEVFPQAQIVYTKDLMASFASVAQGKIDAFVGNKLNMELAIYNGLKGVRLLDGSIGQGNVCAVALSPRTEIPNLKGRINEFLKQVKSDGTLDDMRARWIEKHDLAMPDIPEAQDPKLHLIVGTTGLSEPFTCYVNGELSGYDVELAKRFASWLGASIEFKVYDYEGIVPAAQGGDVDCIFANLYVTPERQEAIEFSDPTFIVDIGVMVRDANSEGGGIASFFSSMEESFEKTFLREDRWKLFAEGIATTLLIAILSILLGTLIGFAVYMICRKGNRAANAITRFCIWLIEGMPVVVLLMILYYVVFSEANISGVAVSVIAFTLIFAASAFNMLKAGVAAVGAGQMEAAYSLGYSDTKAFFKIILPQALRHVMPSYKVSIKSLIKATAVVGYVAVQDLTKMGDIVRSRTYEAFFPLIAIAVIYFILAALLIWIVNKIELRAIPGRGPSEDIGGEAQKK